MSSTTPTITVRASSMPMALRCPGSINASPDAVRINETNEAADTGTAVHDALHDLVLHGEVQRPISQIAAARGVSPDEVEVLYHMAARMWSVIGRWFDVLGSEVTMERNINKHVKVTGHADVVGKDVSDPKTMWVVDWKSGRLDADHYDQIAAYAWLGLNMASLKDQGFDRVSVALVWIRERDVERYDFTRDEVEAWAESAAHTLQHWDGTYHPGPSCDHCPRRHDCPARLAMMRADIAELDDLGDETAVDAMVAALVDRAEQDPQATDRLANLLAKAKSIAALAERVRSAVRDRIAARGEPLDGNDFRVAATKVNTNKLISANAWPVLAPVVGEDFLREIAEISKTKVYEAIKATAPRGQKKGVVEDVEALLLKANAFRPNSYHRLDVKRAINAIEAKGSTR